jgi:ribosome-associated protein
LPNSHGARRRQLQFIGKLMRELDHDEIILAIARLKTQGLADSQQQQQPTPSQGSEWCARILSGEDAEINALLQARPELERQQLRQLQRDHRRADARKRASIEEKLEDYLRSFAPP